MGKISELAAARQSSAASIDHAELRRVAIQVGREHADDDVREAWRWPFLIVRRLRTVPGVTKATNPTLPMIQAAVVLAHDALMLGEAVGDSDFANSADLVVAVVAVWGDVAFADGHGPLELAIEFARQRPIVPQPSLGRPYQLLVSIAWYLQQLHPTEPIYLPVRKLGALLGVSPVHVGRLLRAARLCGHLELVDESYRPGVRARRFRCLVQPTQLPPRQS